MKYPWGTIACILGTTLNAFIGGMDLVAKDMGSLLVNTVLFVLCGTVAITLAVNDYTSKNRIIEDCIKRHNV